MLMQAPELLFTASALAATTGLATTLQRYREGVRELRALVARLGDDETGGSMVAAAARPRAVLVSPRPAAWSGPAAMLAAA